MTATTLDVVDADGKAHTVEVGAWWWARLDGPEPEAVCIARHGVEVAGGRAYRWAVLLGPVVPYVSAPPRTRRDVVLTPVPGDVLDTPLYRLHVDRVDGDTVYFTQTWYDGAAYSSFVGPVGWRGRHAGPKGSRPRVTPVAYPAASGTG